MGTELRPPATGRRAASEPAGPVDVDHRYYDFRSHLRVIESGDWLTRLEKTTRTWLLEKGYDVGAGLPASSRTGSHEVLLDGLALEGAPAFRLTLLERGDQGEFRTEVLAVAGVRTGGWIGVTTHSAEGRFVNRPRLVPRLLEEIQVQDGGSELVDDTWAIGVGHLQEFLDVLSDRDRLAPVFVTAARPGEDVEKVRRWMASRSRELAGLAHSFVLDAEANAMLMRGLGPSMGVQPGTIRSFANSPVPHDPSDALRHRVIGVARLLRLPPRAAAALVGRIARFEAATHPEPVALRDARRAFDRKAIGHRFRRPVGQTDRPTAVEPPRPAHVPPAAATPSDDPAPRVVTPSEPSALPATTTPTTRPTVEQSPSVVPRPQQDETERASPWTPAIDPAVGSPAEAPKAPPAPVGQPESGLRPGLDRLFAATGSSSLDDVINAFRAMNELLEDAEKDARYALAREEQLEDGTTELERALGELELELSNEISRRRTAEQNTRLLSTYSAPEDKQETGERHPTELEHPEQFSDIPIAALDLEQYVVFTGDTGATEELDEYDQYNLGAKRCWEGLLALYDYARARHTGTHEGGFWQYLQRTPGGYAAFPVRDFAAVESESTMQRKDLELQRLLPVPATVDSSGRIVMWAHMKLSQVGRISPRLHFHDDVAASGKVYVGYIGRHLGISSDG